MILQRLGKTSSETIPKRLKRTKNKTKIFSKENKGEFYPKAFDTNL
jgi:hypothetical protein